MARRKIISTFFSVLLLVFFNSNLPFDLRPVPSGNVTSFISLSNAHQQPGHSLSKPAADREHARVRYMGSECCYHAVPLQLTFIDPFFGQQFRFPAGNDVTAPGARCLFTLRGPPCSASSLPGMSRLA